MPRVIELEGWIHVTPNPNATPPYDFEWWPYLEWGGSTMVMPHTVRFEVPDDFEPTPLLIAQLRREQQGMRAEAEHKCQMLEEQISKLQALTFSESAKS
jgi:hypothetical protein